MDFLKEAPVAGCDFYYVRLYFLWVSNVETLLCLAQLRLCL